MDHVWGVEAVVAELVKHDLVGGEIVNAVGKLRQSLVDSEQEGALAELVAMSSIL